ncbi:MAG: type II toxin-antitoxin system RelE/ParE family toxin [Actinomycetota bacterium]|nr:type II toxin-antitoxin system RelE/ParE family toxin [Actinomycetota bacterium]
MTYRVKMARSASTSLQESLPEAVAAASIEFILGPLAEEPRRVGAPLREPYARLWRARRGEYRVRYRVEEDSRTVVVLDMSHRRDAYRR